MSGDPAAPGGGPEPGPELDTDPDPDLDLAGYGPPRVEDRLPADPAPPGPDPGSTRWTTTRVVVVVLGGLGILLAGGCGALVWANWDQIADTTIDFADAQPVEIDGSCRVTGVDLAGRYELEATARSGETGPVHLRLDLTLEADGEVLGETPGILRDVEPGEERTEPVANTIRATEPARDVTCRVGGAVAVAA